MLENLKMRLPGKTPGGPELGWGIDCQAGEDTFGYHPETMHENRFQTGRALFIFGVFLRTLSDFIRFVEDRFT